MGNTQNHVSIHPKLTVREIARQLGVAPSTVSRALDDHPRISSHTKALVKRTLAEMTKEVRSQEFSTIGLFLPNDLNDAFFSSVVRGAMKFADGNGIYLLLEQISSFEQMALPYAVQRERVDGAIVAGLPIADELVRKLAAQEIPVAFIGRYLTKRESAKLNAIVSDNHVGGRLAAEHLIDCGYDELIVMAPPGPLCNPLSDRTEGFLDVVKGIRPTEICPWNIIDGHMAGEPLHKVLTRLERGHRVGVFALIDYAARALIEALKCAGVSVPDQVGVVGYDGMESPEAGFTPGLTTIDVPKENLGYMAGHLLRDIALGQVPTPIQIHIHPQLVIRGSTERGNQFD